MRLRSLLFVPGNRPDRFDKAVATGADALILDLEDAVAEMAKPAAREAVRLYLRDRSHAVLVFVRINRLGGAHIADDLAALRRARPDGLVLPKAEGAASVTALAALLDAALPILPIATETPAALFQLGTYAQVTAMLAGLTWGAEDLPSAIGAATAREPDGRYTPPYELVRSMALFGAHAAGVPAIETVFPDIRDLDGLAAYAARGMRDGFSGMLAIHPAQVAPINAAFSHGEAALTEARAIVAAAAAAGGAGAFQHHGQMIDAPHLDRARRIIAEAQKGKDGS